MRTLTSSGPDLELAVLPEPEDDPTNLYFNFSDERLDDFGRPLNGRAHALTLFRSVGHSRATAFIAFWNDVSGHQALVAGMGNGRVVVEVTWGHSSSHVVGPAGGFRSGIAETLKLTNDIRIAVRADELVGIEAAADIVWHWLRTGALGQALEFRVPVGFEAEIARGDRQP